MKRWDKGSELRITERLSLPVFSFLPSYIPHVSMHFEKSRRLSVLRTIWNFLMISAEKVPGSFDLVPKFEKCSFPLQLTCITMRVA